MSDTIVGDSPADLPLEQQIKLAAEYGKSLLEDNHRLEELVQRLETTVLDNEQEIMHLRKQTDYLRELNESRLRHIEQSECLIKELETKNIDLTEKLGDHATKINKLKRNLKEFREESLELYAPPDTPDILHCSTATTFPSRTPSQSTIKRDAATMTETSLKFKMQNNSSAISQQEVLRQLKQLQQEIVTLKLQYNEDLVSMSTQLDDHRHELTILFQELWDCLQTNNQMSSSKWNHGSVGGRTSKDAFDESFEGNPMVLCVACCSAISDVGDDSKGNEPKTVETQTTDVKNCPNYRQIFNELYALLNRKTQLE